MPNSLRLNLGSGGVRLEGFLNVDVDVRGADVAAMIDALPFADGAVETLYASHVLEHYLEVRPRRTVAALLRSWCDLLAPGGVIYLAVPDFEALARIYASPGAAPSVRATVLAAVFGGHRHEWDRHYAGYCREKLTGLLTEAGFSDVATFEPFANDETRHAIGGQPISLNLRAVKANAASDAQPQSPLAPEPEDEWTTVRRAADERLAVLLVQRERIEVLEAESAKLEAECRAQRELMTSPRALMAALVRALFK